MLFDKLRVMELKTICGTAELTKYYLYKLMRGWDMRFCFTRVSKMDCKLCNNYLHTHQTSQQSFTSSFVCVFFVSILIFLRILHEKSRAEKERGESEEGMGKSERRKRKGVIRGRVTEGLSQKEIESWRT